MASISTDARGNRRILFVADDGKRKPIRLGKLPMKATETIKIRVEHLVAAKAGGNGWDPETARWVSSIGDELAAKLAAVGLISKRARSTLGDFTTTFITDRTPKWKPKTLMNFKHAERFLLDHFKPDCRLQDITPGDADDFRRYVESKVAENTARRIVGRAKQVFRAAVRKRLVAENPFADMRDLAVRASKGREFFVTREISDKVLTACPNTQWRLLFSLARYGGLRTPSEVYALTWADIDWERDRIRVTSVKTEHHEGHSERWVPIFPEIKPHLEQAFAEAEPGALHVITLLRYTHGRLRFQFDKVVQRAGLESWPKPFQNCRATRETELAETYPIHVVCAWIGNSPTIAKKHYLQVTDAHFAKAAQKQAQPTADDLAQPATTEKAKVDFTP